MDSLKQAREMLSQSHMVYSGGEYRAVIRELVGDLEQQLNAHLAVGISSAPTKIAELVERINKLRAKATPGPWERDFDTRYERQDRESHLEHFLTADKKRCIAVASNQDANELTLDDEGRYEDKQGRADLDFVAALVTAWPQLYAAISAREAPKTTPEPDGQDVALPAQREGWVSVKRDVLERAEAMLLQHAKWQDGVDKTGCGADEDIVIVALPNRVSIIDMAHDIRDALK